jgi:hypothetical protein
VPGRPPTFRCLFTGLIPLFPLPSAVTAQVNVEVLPYAGLYVPTQNLMDPFVAGNTLFYSNPRLYSLKQKRQVALGGRLTVWWTRHRGAEVTLGYSPSGVSTVAAHPVDSSAHAITASARALLRISPAAGSPWLGSCHSDTS